MIMRTDEDVFVYGHVFLLLSDNKVGCKCKQNVFKIKICRYTIEAVVKVNTGKLKCDVQKMKLFTSKEKKTGE